MSEYCSGASSLFSPAWVAGAYIGVARNGCFCAGYDLEAERYRAVWTVDDSTLDALLRKIGLLKDLPKNPLAGKITALLEGFGFE